GGDERPALGLHEHAAARVGEPGGGGERPVGRGHSSSSRSSVSPSSTEPKLVSSVAGAGGGGGGGSGLGGGGGLTAAGAALTSGAGSTSTMPSPVHSTHIAPSGPPGGGTTARGITRPIQPASRSASTNTVPCAGSLTRTSGRTSRM